MTTTNEHPDDDFERKADEFYRLLGIDGNVLAYTESGGSANTRR